MIHAPLLIIGCPRSGTTLLFNILSEAPDLWSLGHESGEIIERWHHPRHKDWESGVLTADDLTPESAAGINRAFERAAAPGTFWRRVNRFRSWLRDNPLWQEIKRRGRTAETGSATSSALPQQGLSLITKAARLRNRILPSGDRQPIHLLEKTPENCLRLPFLLALWPDARVLFLVRDGRSNINSLIEGWKHPHLFHGYQPPAELAIPGNGQPDKWAFTLIPDWSSLTTAPLEEVCARQWLACNRAVLAHQAQTAGRVPYLMVRYEQLIEQPGTILEQIAEFSGHNLTNLIERYANGLPEINVVTRPDKEKWRQQNPEAIAHIEPLIKPLMNQLDY